MLLWRDLHLPRGLRMRGFLRMSGCGCGTTLTMTETLRSPADDTPASQVVSEALSAHEGELRRFMSARMPAHEVDDAIQLAALRAVERASTLHDTARVLPWLYTIHRNIVTDLLRARARTARWMDDTTPAPDAAGPVPDVDARCDCSVAQARGLSPNYADVLNLVDLRGATLADAASTLGITVNNATVRLHRARKALREAMLAHCGVQSARECLDCRCVDDGCCAGS